MSYIKSLFTIKKAPTASEVKVSEETHKRATALLYFGLFVLLANVIGSLVKILFFSGLKVSVDELEFSVLLFSVIILFVTSAASLIKLINAHTDILKDSAEKKYKVVLGALGPFLVSIYICFLSINEAVLLGSYNKNAYENICKVDVTNDKKSDICLSYERKMAIDKSFVSRAVYFYDFK